MSAAAAVRSPVGRAALSDAITASGSMPSISAAIAASRIVRTASFGTATTLSLRSMFTDTSPFMPGSSRRSLFGSEMMTGNIVTDC